MESDKTVEYRSRRGLVDATEPRVKRRLWRKPGFDGVTSLRDMDEAIGEFLATARSREGLTREQVAELLGITGQVYGRYERAQLQLNVTRLVHLSEVLGFEPMEMIHAAAPHLFGDTLEQAKKKIALMRLMSRLKPEVVDSLLLLVGELSSEGDTPAGGSARG